MGIEENMWLDDGYVSIAIHTFYTIIFLVFFLKKNKNVLLYYMCIGP